MSTLPMTASTADAAMRSAGHDDGGFLARMFVAWSRYQARVARGYVDQQLKRFSDEELREMGYCGLDVARIRAANENVPQHWI